MKSRQNKVKPAPEPTPEFSIRALLPDDTPEYMMPAWISCMSWALTNDEIMAAFREDSGNQWQPGRSSLDKMIDDATGAGKKFITEFVRWANIHVWGPIE